MCTRACVYNSTDELKLNFIYIYIFYIITLAKSALFIENVVSCMHVHTLYRYNARALTNNKRSNPIDSRLYVDVRARLLRVRVYSGN